MQYVQCPISLGRGYFAASGKIAPCYFGIGDKITVNAVLPSVPK